MPNACRPAPNPPIAPRRRGQANRPAPHALGALAAVCALAVGLAGLVQTATAGALEVQVSDGAGKPLPGAVVFLESPEAKAASKPAVGVELGQALRQFSQAVTVVPVGTAVNFPNRDTVRHHVYSFSAVKKFEIKLYVGTPAAPVVFDQPGIAVLGCNIHDNMAAWVVIVDTPFYGLTGANGRLALPAVPAGSYQLRTWHPALAPGAPALAQPLLVPAAGSVAAVKMAGLLP